MSFAAHLASWLSYAADVDFVAVGLHTLGHLFSRRSAR